MNHTPGPWRWELNRQHKSIHLVGGRPMFDKTVMQFGRWGMGNATPLFNEAVAGGQYNIMGRVCDMKDWVKPFPGRDHHADWCQQVVHPDALLMQSAPLLLQALVETLQVLEANGSNFGAQAQIKARSAIASLNGFTA